jgi:putative ABC transport system ATP-binding protein
MEQKQTNNKQAAIEQVINAFQGDRKSIVAAINSYTQPSLLSRRIVTSSTANTIVSIQDVKKSYKIGDHSIDALRNISLSITKGEFIALTGPSGSGKSTLLQLIGALDKPTSGEVIIDGRSTSTLNDIELSRLRRNTIGFIFQSFYLQPFLNLEDNVAVPAMFSGVNSQLIKERTLQLLAQVGLEERKDHYPNALSGGQIQRGAIARALINSPKLLLADEPTGNLDAENSIVIMDLFQKIRDTLGTTIIMVTHNQDIAQQADRSIEIRNGNLA